MVFALLLLFLVLFFCFVFFFYFSSTFSCSYSSHFILFLFCFCFCPQKPELNPKPRTLHPKLSDGPLHWTPPPLDAPSAGQPSAGQPSAGQPSAGQPSAGPPKISLFFSLLPPQFSFFSPSLGGLSLNFGGVFEFRDPEMCMFALSGWQQFEGHEDQLRRWPEHSKKF